MKRLICLVGMICLVGCEQVPNNVQTIDSDSQKLKKDNHYGIDTKSKTVEKLEPSGQIVEKEEPVPNTLLQIEREQDDYLKSAQASIKEGDLEQGMSDLQKVLFEEPESYEAAMLLGLTARKLDKNDLARQAFESAARNDLHEDLPWIELARLAIEEDKLDDAENHIHRALDIDPDNPLSQNMMGRVWLNRSHWELAIKYFQKAHEMAPEAIYYRNNLGLAWFMKKDFEKALEILEPLGDMQGLPAFMYNNVGLACESTGKIQKSADMYRLALENKPTYVKAQVNLDRLVELAGLESDDEPNSEERETLTVEEGLVLSNENLGSSMP